MTVIRTASFVVIAALLTGCVTSTVDEMVFNEPTEGIGDATVQLAAHRSADRRDA